MEVEGAGAGGRGAGDGGRGTGVGKFWGRGLYQNLLYFTDFYVLQCNSWVSEVYNRLIMPPTSKKLEGHIASGKFVRPSVRPCVRPLRLLMHSITYEPCMLGF